MTVVEKPSVTAGFRLALRLRKLVVAVWVAALTVFLPALLVVQLAGGPVFSRLPEHSLPEGETFLILVEVLRPVAIPLALALLSGGIALVAWSILWHGGVVRWWLGAGAARVRLAEILGHGIVWWWRYARLTCVGAVFFAVALASLWLPVQVLLGGLDSGAHAGLLLVSALAASLLATIIIWVATLRGGWLLGESGRRSALVAWSRGLGATLRRPFSSLIPVLVWAIPPVVLLVMPLLVESPWAAPALVIASLGAAFCWVALYLSFAPQEPAEEWYRKMQARAASRVASPAEKPDPYKTGRIPTKPEASN